MSRVACIGAGNVGRAWAIRFAMAGHDVSLFDVTPEILDKSLEAIDQSLIDLERAGRIESAAATRTRMAACEDLDQALDQVTYVQENVTEDVDVKCKIFSRLDKQSPDSAVLASSTSEITGSQIFSHLDGRSRCIIAHPLNPPFLIPMVELCPSPWTSEETMAQAKSFLTASGQKPIIVKKEICGFVANRLQLAVLGEALHLVGEGYCSVEDIDIAMKEGLALRWAVIGPFETGHLNASEGYRAYLDIFKETHKKIIADLNVGYDWDDALIDRVHRELVNTTPVSEVPARQAWRDRRLIELNKHIKEATEEFG